MIIIGAGIAGLAAGCYAQMNGYRTKIFELHNQPGGLCTAWQRRGYTFDGCIHYLFGSGPGQPFYQLWQELGAIQGRQFVHHDQLTTPYQYWQRIYGRAIYNAEEIQESGILIDQLEQFYPGIKADIEFVDVATPLSYERYTGNWQGSSCGWLLNKQTMPLLITGLPKTLPGLHHFYQIGQWVEPGGSVPVVAMSGRNIIQQICHEDRKTFMTTIPQ
ncbi:NAD(P)-binding protein [Leptolyngbya cf. ectocarpi LEGE 11479]|uniref:NAD(P)-binding protein n=2 Tax=Leptolyngbya ectocarpi TaxID=1202 RepID=A0A929F8L5_LEPEC|nr:NAD(P)-binding protein [Leptolyngbya cf. ectocarpi LEGE 11479]